MMLENHKASCKKKNMSVDPSITPYREMNPVRSYILRVEKETMSSKKAPQIILPCTKPLAPKLNSPNLTSDLCSGLRMSLLSTVPVTAGRCGVGAGQ